MRPELAEVKGMTLAVYFRIDFQIIFIAFKAQGWAGPPVPIFPIFDPPMMDEAHQGRLEGLAGHPKVDVCVVYGLL